MKETRSTYAELGLPLRKKHPKRRVKAKLRVDRQIAVGPNDVWVMDSVYDQLATGKKLPIPTIVDTYSRFLSEIDGGRTAGSALSQCTAILALCYAKGMPQILNSASAAQRA